MFRGSFTAMVTPFQDGDIDWTAFDLLIEQQIEAGSHGIVVCGTTGESPTLTPEEHMAVIRRAVKVVGGRIPVIAGTGSNATAKTIDMTQAALDDGADAALIVAPYYNKPTQEGLYQHYKAIAEAVKIPLIVYNIPGRSVVDISNETMARLAKISNIIGVKDATADLTRPTDLKEKVGPDFIQLSGEDATVIEFLEAGGHGCISVTSNIAPALCAQLHNAWIVGDHDKARSINETLMPLHQALFVEPNPTPAKYVLQALGLCRDEMRLPLIPATQKCRALIDEALAQVGLLPATKQEAHG